MSHQETLLGPYLQPGTRIKVGQYSTKIVRYLSEGGFSHVYIARLDISVKGSDIAVLKRIVAPDKGALSAIRTEVDTMKRLKGHRYIVTYIDSHASALKTGGFEVYVLMEYCPGGGLIDFMNTRLQTRLAEWEVLKIFSDTAEAVACMHYLQPPLLHRDLKIENVLISGDGCYKLCDFGSCTEPRPAATNSQERRELEDDIQKNTTIQYRSPEMVDVARRLPIDEKSDIWALGVLLYKLCYFTTPFESQGQLAILNAAYTFPPYPPYTDRTKRLIAVTLQENPHDRPNIYQLVAEVCAMRNVSTPIKDIYSRSKTDRVNGNSKSLERSSRPAEDVLQFEPVISSTAKEHKMPSKEINPMRRGRPVRAASPQKTAIIPLDFPHSKDNLQSRTPAAGLTSDETEFTTKYPSLEEIDFAIESKTGIPASVDAEKADSSTRQLVSGTADPTGRHIVLSEPSREVQAQDITTSVQSRPLPLPPSPQGHGVTEERILRPSEVGRSGNYIRRNPQTFDRPQHQENPDTSTSQSSASLRATHESSVPVLRPKPIYKTLDSASANKSNSKLDMALATEARPNHSHIANREPESSKVNRLSMREIQESLSKPVESSTSPKFRPESVPRHGDLMTKSRAESRMDPLPSVRLAKPRSNNDAGGRSRDGASDFRPNSAAANRQTIHIDSDMDYLKDFRHTDTNLGAGDISSADSDFTGPEREFHKPPLAPSSSGLRRSVSVNASSNRHGRRPSLGKVPSFSGAAKNIMNGKFGDAFKKFESSGRSKGSIPGSTDPLQVEEADLPEHITQHMKSSEARRSLSYSKTRPSLEGLRSEVPIANSQESSSTSVKEAMRLLKEKATQAYVPQRSAQGYGKYTDTPGLPRASTVIPTSRTPPVQSITQAKPTANEPSKNYRRYALQEDDDEFSKRYPSLSDFKV